MDKHGQAWTSKLFKDKINILGQMETQTRAYKNVHEQKAERQT